MESHQPGKRKPISAPVDTSVLVRYLTGTPEEMAARAAAILDGDEVLGVSLLVLAETAYVLLSVYGVPRRQVVESLIWLLQKENLQPIGWAKSQVLQALMRCLPSGRVSIADALLWAEAHAHGVRQVYTFDRRFPDQRLTLLN